MKLIVPSYYQDFHCLADKCQDCCCKCWEIDIDKKTENYYKQVTGEFGKKLEENINYNNPATFILKENENCPFLTENKLCEIYINLGEDKMCDICKEHPRYYEWFDNFKEGGVGMCCEEAARLILTSPIPFTTINLESSDTTTEEDYDSNFYTFLNQERAKLITYIEQNKNINIKLLSLIDYADILQDNLAETGEKTQTTTDINNIKITPSDYPNTLKGALQNILLQSPQSFYLSFISVLKFFKKLDPLQPNWNTNLNNFIKYSKQNKTTLLNQYQEFEKNLTNSYLENLTTYFIWRHFIKATFNLDVIAKLYFTALSTTFIKMLMFFKWTQNQELNLNDWILTCKYYSEEIEYSDENMNIIDDTFFYEEEI